MVLFGFGAAVWQASQDRRMNRREFIAAICGAAAVWPFAVHAQQPAMPESGQPVMLDRILEPQLFDSSRSSDLRRGGPIQLAAVAGVRSQNPPSTRSAGLLRRAARFRSL